MTPEHAWVQIQRQGETEILLKLNVGSFKNPLLITMDVGDWSRMLSKPGVPTNAQVTFEDTP